MAGIYTLTILTEFSASHILRGHPGPCSRLHGHNWKVEAEVVAESLNDIDLAIDFQDIKAAARAITDRLDHRHLNDLPPFDRVNPTAEQLARYIYGELGRDLSAQEVRVSAVTIWETDRAKVRYSERQSLGSD